MKRLILLSFLAFPVARSAAALPYVSQSFGFALEYPAELVVKECPYPSCALRLESASGYPTFNVVAAPGALEIGPKRADFIESQIVSDYTRLGLSDVTIKERSVFEQTPGSQMLVFVLSYKSQDKSYISQVSVTSAPESHFFLTFTTSSQKFQEDKTLGEALRKSFHLLKTQGSPPAATFNWLPWTVGLLVLLSALIVVKRVWLR